jgi:DNA-directed RNA polymerase specialized sigma24 family protein
MAGDASAFDALVIKYKDMVYTMCYYLLGDVGEAADHSQETFSMKT